MPLDINTIVTSLTSSVIVAGAIAYVLKKSFDRTLDLKIEELKEQRKAEINELNRRKGQIFDKQCEIFRTVLSLVYRSRNSAKQILDRFCDPTEESKRSFEARDDVWLGFRSYSDSLIQMLYDERAIMPPTLFAIAHEMKHALAVFQATTEHLRHTAKLTDPQRVTHHAMKLNDLKAHYEKINQMYELITDEVQKRIGTAS